MVPLRSQGFCGVGRGLSGLDWVWCNGRGSHLVLRTEPQVSSPFLTPISGFLQSWDRRVRPSILCRNETLLASRFVHEVTGHLSSCMWNLWNFPKVALVCRAPSCCAFIHRYAFKEVSGHRVLINSGPGNGVFLHVATPTRLCLQFPRETGLILRCARKVGNPFQTKQGNRPSCRHQEGRRGSAEAVLEPPCSPRVRPGCQGNLGVASRVPSTVSHFKTEHGLPWRCYS